MPKALLLVILVGTAIGLMLPLEDRAAAPTADAPASAAAPATTPAAGVAAPRETVLERSDNGHFYANAEVNGQLVRFVVDTGATGVALTEEDAARIGIPFSRDTFRTVGEGASGPVRGAFVDLGSVRLDGKEVRDLEGAVLEGSTMSLLGQAYLGRFSVEMRGDRMRIY